MPADLVQAIELEQGLAGIMMRFPWPDMTPGQRGALLVCTGKGRGDLNLCVGYREQLLNSTVEFFINHSTNVRFILIKLTAYKKRASRPDRTSSSISAPQSDDPPGAKGCWTRLPPSGAPGLRLENHPDFSCFRPIRFATLSLSPVKSDDLSMKASNGRSCGARFLYIAFALNSFRLEVLKSP
jgi:hypothetical protein